MRDAQESRGLGDVYKRQNLNSMHSRAGAQVPFSSINLGCDLSPEGRMVTKTCLLYTSDAADDLLCVDLGGRRLIKTKTTISHPHELAGNQH